MPRRGTGVEELVDVNDAAVTSDPTQGSFQQISAS